MISTDIAIWIQAILILMYLSQLYRDNPLYKFAEYTLIGAAVGHGAVLAYKNVVSMVYVPITVKGEYILLVPIVLGFLIWTRLSRNYSWVSRYPMALIIAVATGLAVRGAVGTQIYGQIIPTVELMAIKPDMLTTANNYFIAITVLCTILYFIYLIEHKGPFGVATKIGRLTMMAAFGTSIAWVYLSRLASLIAQMQILLQNWLGLGV